MFNSLASESVSHRSMQVSFRLPMAETKGMAMLAVVHLILYASKKHELS